MPKIIEDEKVYRAVMQTVVERGYAGATTKQMAKAADISEVTLFRKYGSKAELVKAAIVATAEQIDIASATRYSGNVSGDLLRVVTTYQGTARTVNRFFYTLLLEIPRNPELTEIIDAQADLLGSIGLLLARYQAEGVLVEEHPLHAVAGLLGPMIAVNMLRSAYTGAPFPPLDLANHVARFLDGRYMRSADN